MYQSTTFVDIVLLRWYTVCIKGEMQMIILIFLSAIVGGIALYHAVRYIKGSKKHHVAFVNVSLVIAAALSLVAIYICISAAQTDSLKYMSFEGYLVSGTHKDSEGNEYYVITDYPGPNGDVVVASSDAELSLMCKAVGEVRVYYTGGKEECKVDGYTYYRLKNVVKISPDHLGILIWFTVITVLVLLAFNIIIAAVNANRRKQ